MSFKSIEWFTHMNARIRRRTILDSAPLDPVKLRVIADPLRSFVLYSLVPEAKTVRRLAEEVGCPKTRLYYHLQQLEKHGLVFVERTRKVSGIIEKSYRASARDWILDRTRVDPRAAPGRSRVDALLAFVFDQTRLEIQRQVESGALDLTRRAPDPKALMAYRSVLKLDQAQAGRLYGRLLDFWMEYEEIAKAPAVDGDFYAFTVALYPNAMETPGKGKAR
jgi:AcrR family transcriptional regulator